MFLAFEFVPHANDFCLRLEALTCKARPCKIEVVPARNSRKQYQANGYYHLYNRGVEKRVIFLDKQDYGVFLSYLKEYLMEKDLELLQERLRDKTLSSTERDKIWKQLRLNNFSDTISLFAYCLMPNHFHLFVKQLEANTIDIFMNSLCTRYSMYFNKKYDRVGSLYQGVYKAVMVQTEEQFLHLSRYIHQQALTLQGLALQEKYPSSFGDFCGLRRTEWIKPSEVLSYFSTTNPQLSYESFIRQKNNVLDTQFIIEDC